MNRWWHFKILEHTQRTTRVTVSMFDSSKGLLTRCSCGKVWAR